MENQTSKLDKIVKISLIIGVLIIALSVAYYLVVYVPQRDKSKLEQQKQEQEAQIAAKTLNKKSLDDCLSQNDDNRLKSNLSIAEMRKTGKISATDIGPMIDENNKRFDDLRQECFKKYTQD